MCQASILVWFVFSGSLHPLPPALQSELDEVRGGHSSETTPTWKEALFARCHAEWEDEANCRPSE